MHIVADNEQGELNDQPPQQMDEHPQPEEDEQQPESGTVSLRDLKKRVFEVLPDDILPPPKKKCGV